MSLDPGNILLGKGTDEVGALPFFFFMAHLEVVYLDALSHLRVLRIPQALPLRTRMLTILGAVRSQRTLY